MRCRETKGKTSTVRILLLNYWETDHFSGKEAGLVLASPLRKQEYLQDLGRDPVRKDTGVKHRWVPLTVVPIPVSVTGGGGGGWDESMEFGQGPMGRETTAFAVVWGPLLRRHNLGDLD